MRLAQALLLIPPGFHLRCGCERNPETGAPFGSATLFLDPPEEGWPNPPHPAHRFLAKVITSISTDETDDEAFELLIVNMVVGEFGISRQKAEARARLNLTAARREQDHTVSKKGAW